MEIWEESEVIPCGPISAYAIPGLAMKILDAAPVNGPPSEPS